MMPRPMPLDLLEMRKQLMALRSSHSDNQRLTAVVNDLLVKIAYLKEPESRAHEQRLRNKISKTVKLAERIAKRKPTRKPTSSR